MNKATLGLAYRAKKVILGTDPVVDAMRQGEVVLVLLASDASDNTKKKIRDKATTYQVPLSEDYTAMDLSQALGKDNIKVCGIKDRGFASLLK
ncbi:MAG TPA: ribosomal L7Ae/L30e/S12e/Gadd45 family protein [Acholeplasma sp.]|jgi:ribosomal protein L7Ae-like RNA K-turn-binding protein